MPRPSSTSASRTRQLLWGTALLGLGLATVLGLDRLVYLRRESLHTSNTGRWALQEWREKQAVVKGLAAPPEILFLGDSTMSRDLRPSLIHPRAQNLARSGLQGVELPELDQKLDQLGETHPRIIVLSMLPEQFRAEVSDRALLEGARPGLKEVLLAYYTRPNLSQLAFFPGTRVAKYQLDALVARLDRVRSFRTDADGALLFLAPLQAPGTPIQMPGFMSNPAGFLDQARLAPLEAFVRHWEARGTLLVYLFVPVNPSLTPAYESRFAPDLAFYQTEVARIFRGRVIHLEIPPPDTDFYDATHLNAAGATAFSQRVGEALRPYLAQAGLSPEGNPSAPHSGL